MKRAIPPVLWDRAVDTLPLGSSAEKLDGDVGITLSGHEIVRRLEIAAQFFSFLGGAWILDERVEDARGTTLWYRRLP